MIDEIEGLTGVNSLSHAIESELAFWNGKNVESMLSSRAKTILVRELPKLLGSKNYIIVDNPKLEFIKYAWEYHPPEGDKGPVKIGKNVTIGENCSIGYDGFGYERDKDGKLWKFPHYAGVVIKSDVEISSNVCIDRGTFDDTYIGEGTKIDNCIHIAHNNHIGKNCVITAGVITSGSVIVGDNVWLGVNSCIREGLEIGEGALVGMGAVVVKDVDPYTTVIGNPARVMER